jgi:DNA-binding CsgD family transcriptional regulator
MLLTLTPELVKDIDPGPIPNWLKPLIDGAHSGRPLSEAVQDIVVSFGFTSFIYGLTTAAHLCNEERFYCWTTAPAAWVSEYDQRSFIEVDPRVHHGWTEVTPFIWDRTVARGNPRIENFLERAAHYGIGSGVNVFLRDARRARIMIGLNSPERLLTPEMTAQISIRLGDLMLFGTIFHAIFVRAFIDKGLSAPQQGVALSPREIQCLGLAARGQTSGDIAFKLGITERTANFHFSNILSKLGAMNRAEAIAKAAAQGLLDDD